MWDIILISILFVSFCTSGKSTRCNVETVYQHKCPSFIALNDSVPISATDGIKIELTSALNDNGAACLDGTVPVVYYREAQDNSAKNKWHIFLEGGGACVGVTESEGMCFDSCEARAGSDLGSSKDYPNTANFDSGYMSTSSKTNPLSYNWNVIYSKYCDGAMWSGDNSTLQPAGKYMLHYRGKRIVQGIFQELINKYNFNEATDVLVSGCSAGGVGVFSHAQWIYENFVPKSAHFLAMPDSGFGPEYQGRGHLIDSVIWMYNNQNTSASLDPNCIKTHKTSEWECSFPPNFVQFITAPIFSLQSRFDAWQTDCILVTANPKEINSYGQNFTNIYVNSFINNGTSFLHHGGFLDSCHHHCGEWNDIHISGMDQSQAEFQFYSKHASGDQHLWFQNETYPCESCCHD